MRIIPRPVYLRDIRAADPFAKDVLGRESLIRNVTRLFKSSDDGLVITINAKWGEGKTSFIKFWDLFLRQDKEFIPIYYDSFRYDFTGDAFVSMAAAIFGGLGDRVKAQAAPKKEEAQLKYLKKASKELAVDLAKMTAGLAVASLSGGLISSGSFVTWAVKAFQRLTFGALKVNADEQFEAYLKSQDSVRSYQDRLRELLVASDGSEQRKIVLFIDELDRCRPAFAVEIIEKAKHLFNVKGVFFVLSINRDQLLRTLESVYGLSGEDVAVYLQKFVDLELRLPSAGEEDAAISPRQIAEMLRANMTELGLTEGALSLLSDVEQLSLLISSGPKLNARGIEKAVSLMAIGIRSCRMADALRLKRHMQFAALIRIGAPIYYEQLARDGSVFEASEARTRPIFSWARNYFGANLVRPQASNVFIVEGLREACGILNMYEVPWGPSGEDDESEASSPGGD